jgi:hypothetical protein
MSVAVRLGRVVAATSWWRSWGAGLRDGPVVVAHADTQQQGEEDEQG